MGTSTSSSGPGANVNFDPPWLDQIGAGNGGDGASSDGATADGTGQAAVPAAVGVAGARRFASARRELGTFARTGSREDLGRAVGHYSKTGMGGARNAAARMRNSTRAAGGLVSFLQSARDGTSPQVSRWIDRLRTSNPSAHDVINAVVQHVVGDGGSLDEEVCKDSMAQAMSELLELKPNVDLLQLGDADIWTLVQLFLGNEACNRLYMDVGQLFESAKLNPVVVVTRLNEMRAFVKSEVAVQLEALRSANPNPTPQQMQGLLQDALRLTFEVYEGTI